VCAPVFTRVYVFLGCCRWRTAVVPVVRILLRHVASYFTSLSLYSSLFLCRCKMLVHHSMASFFIKQALLFCIYRNTPFLLSVIWGRGVCCTGSAWLT
jgi:hypothetical protein